MFTQDGQHALERLRGPPQQLVTDTEGGQVFATHRQLAQTADRYGQGAGRSGRRQMLEAVFLGIGDGDDSGRVQIN